jgi:hypothetical protein
MFTEPRQLIGETIEKLETVSAYFAEEIDEQHRSVGQVPLETLAAKEALQTIKILIPKLRIAQGSLAAQSSQLQFLECGHCD